MGSGTVDGQGFLGCHGLPLVHVIRSRQVDQEQASLIHSQQEYRVRRDVNFLGNTSTTGDRTPEHDAPKLVGDRIGDARHQHSAGFRNSPVCAAHMDDVSLPRHCLADSVYILGS